MATSTVIAVASQAVLHPVVSDCLKILSTTAGRDKVYRTAQYFARFLAWALLSRGHQLEAARWTALKSHLAMGRKLLAIAKPIEHLQAALRASQSPGEQSEQLLATARQICYFGYLSYDTLVWANAIRFFTFKPATAQKVNKISNRFWLAGILLSLTHSLIKAGRLAHDAKTLRASAWSEKGVGSEAGRELKTRALSASRNATRYQFMVDCLDVWLPAANLGLVNFSEGTLGLLGVFTSLMALNTQWDTLSNKK